MNRRELKRNAFCSLLAIGILLLQLSQGYAFLLTPKEATTAVNPEKTFQMGATLTREGKLEEAVPYLISARSHPALRNPASFNLALCYLGLRRYALAIELLESLRALGYNGGQVNTLLAQAYVGMREPDKALAALRQANLLSPASEKPYLFAADACTDNKEYAFGLRVTEAGLQKFPSSARLHYEHAMFLAQLDRFEDAKPEFERATALDHDGNIAYLASAQEALFQGDVKTAAEIVQRGIRAGHHDYVLEALLAGILLHGGAIPGQSGFSEAEELLEDAVAQNPGYSTAQIALGKLYLMKGQFKEAIEHLEVGRRLEPQNQSVYAGLAHAYRRIGDEEKAKEMLRQLQLLIQPAGHLAEGVH